MSNKWTKWSCAGVAFLTVMISVGPGVPSEQPSPAHGGELDGVLGADFLEELGLDGETTSGGLDPVDFESLMDNLPSLELTPSTAAPDALTSPRAPAVP